MDMWQVPSALEAALHLMTRLKQLSLSWMPDRTVASFPTSLVSLQMGAAIDKFFLGEKPLELQHLTRVTHLEVRSLPANAALPSSLRSLHAHNYLNLSLAEDTLGMWPSLVGARIALDQLQMLQHLHLSTHPHNISRLQQLTALRNLPASCRPSACVSYAEHAYQERLHTKRPSNRRL
jgi:hypothetical protein